MSAPTMEVPLAEGELDGDEIECPRHGARFNVCTGAALCMPATEPVECYEVKVEGDTDFRPRGLLMEGSDGNRRCCIQCSQRDY